MDKKDFPGEHQILPMPYIKMEVFDIEEKPPFVKEELQGHADEPNLDVSKYECKICGDIFASDYSLKEHISEYHHHKKTDSVRVSKVHTKVDRPFKCSFEDCNSKYKTVSALNFHLRMHRGENKFKCRFPKCKIVLSSNYNRKSHERMHNDEKPFKCSFESCENTFKRRINLKCHERLHKLDSKSLELIKCDYPGCSSEFRLKRSYQYHMKRHMRGSQYACPSYNCVGSFSKKEDLEEHLKSHSKEEISSNKNIFKCNRSGCNKHFPNSSLLLTHKRLHCIAKTFECKFRECSQKIITFASLKIHLRSHDDNAPFKCTHEGCGKAFKRKDHLKSHRKVHDLDANKIELIKCDYPGCSSKFRWKYSYQDHKKRHTLVPQYGCSSHNCDESFSKKEDLEEHLKSHSKAGISSSNNKRLLSSAKPYECEFEECNKKFTYLASLKKHLRLHDDNAPFRCTHEGCGRVFKKEEYLKGHRRIHDIESNSVELIKCHYPGCKSKFRYERSYQVHIRKHENGFKNRCTFENCVASFVTCGELQEHAKSHKERVNNIKVESHQEDNDESVGEKEMSSDEVLSIIQETKEETIDTKRPVPQHEYEAKIQQNEFKFEEIGRPKSQDSHQYDEMINVYQCFYCQDTFDEENEFKDHIESCGKYSKIDYLEEGQIKPDYVTVDVKSEFQNIQ